MNERFEKLANKVCNSLDSEHDPQFELFLQAYAELIVRECCSAIRHHDVFNGGHLQRLIKEHFGIEVSVARD